ncbi:MAG: HAD family hydrolase [Ilumatobacter fluminis]|uniref:HAD family hydrolase n=1 Tax=Ilumatobacter fluminis TaxID=467091 RepID=UPI0032ED902E
MGIDYDAILFDAGGVLVLPDPTVLGPLLEPYGGDPSVEVHRRAHYAAMAAKSRELEGETEWDSYNVTYVRTVGVRDDLVHHASVVLDHTRTAHLWRWAIPETLTALAALAERGVPMGVVSNASGQVEAALAVAEICQAGDGPCTSMRVVIDSHVVGVAKPDPRIFDFALPYFDEFERDRIVYVGDSVVMDIGGATAAGLTPVLIDPYDDHEGADFARIRAVTDLL